MNKFLIAITMPAWFATSLLAQGATIFESGTLGPTGLAQGSVAATNITPNVFTGVRFELTHPVETTQVGGHFVSSTGGTFFGAIVELDDEDDFPDTGDLASSDVLGHAELTFPTLSDEVFGDLDLALQPGFYALVFGSGLFDTTGDGAATRNNEDIGNPDYIAFVSSRWRPLEGTSIPFDNHRFVLRGTIIPEPSALGLAVATFALPLIRRR